MHDEEQMPLISIITPTYNAEKYIDETIMSVVKQSYTNWEMIIVDDGSKDKTIDLIKSYQKADNRINLTILQHNQGAGIARNTALKKANGKYIAFLDSDDKWLPEKLKKQLNFMQENNIAFSFTEYDRIQNSDSGQKIIKRVHIPTNANYKQLLKKNVVGCLTVMIDTSLTGEITMNDIRARQDYALWLELTRKGFKAYGIQEVLAEYRVRGNSISSNKLKMARQNWMVYRKVEKLNIWKSIWYFSHYLILKTKEYLRYVT
ncbi:glycosyltransferase family 2 protein [Paraliobacillus zengyii]|uniref:glycosyltransferase family 2 protein n=1 Tax=Paraliobacillus zengyii TaxID=2213194 RepID=UPI000E3DAA18|nr:glycosyltransferase family 2 protein [Paraliobacillus zengyii]